MRDKVMMNPVEIVRHEEMRQVVKLGFLAKILIRVYSTLGEFLYERGYVSDVADVDAMTGLYNKNFFERWVPKVLAQARRSGVVLSFIYFDMNDLKKANDSHGHAQGDWMLRSFARSLLKGFRESDLIFRLGGDEFAAVLWNCHENKAIEKTLQIRQKLDEKRIRFSFGVVEVRGKKTIKRIVHEADKLMYEMKRVMKAKKDRR